MTEQCENCEWKFLKESKDKKDRQFFCCSCELNYWKRKFFDESKIIDVCKWVLDKMINVLKYLDRFDYLMSLTMHSICWTFLIMLPVAFSAHFNVGDMFAFTFLANVVMHSVVDNMKANQRVINLIEDQLLHIGQIIITYFVLIR